ncbi:MAG TPA: PilX N-terminal domain-containing pilus assembly protein [Candidatus Saccharimonadales bacterium]|nr:PilX N-terminal domain-containing pilus assembly protein [Candidatus Saccharimonadales bacterium]
MRQSQPQTKKLDENGFASIVIALVLIVVLALLTVGFAQLARREQNDALNRQLANQAYYAAESGVNDVVHAIPAINAANVASPGSVSSASCLTSSQLSSFSLNPTLNGTAGVAYTCALVNLTPPTLVYDNVAAESERYVSFSTSPSPLSTITFQWGSADNHTTPQSAAAGSFKPLASWGSSPAVLQVSITPFDPSNVDQNAMIAATYNAYLYPSASAGGLAYNTSQQGGITSGGCINSTTRYTCSATISGLPSAPEYLVRAIPHYDSTNISINGHSGASVVDFINGQALVDVTGKAQQVLKRIQVRVPIGPSYTLPKDAIEVGSTCKRFQTQPNQTIFDSSLGSSSCTLDP